MKSIEKHRKSIEKELKSIKSTEKHSKAPKDTEQNTKKASNMYKKHTKHANMEKLCKRTEKSLQSLKNHREAQKRIQGYLRVDHKQCFVDH